MKKLDIEYLRECLIYNALTGEFWWKHRPSSHFKNYAHGYLAWNARNAGKLAGKFDKHGYRMIGINHEFYFAHRIAWALVYGVWPTYEVDHINHIHDDNRIANLRDVPPHENGKNRPFENANKTGVMGVAWHKLAKKWVVAIGSTRKGGAYVGLFASFDEAVAARKAAEIERGYHQNHGSK